MTDALTTPKQVPFIYCFLLAIISWLIFNYRSGFIPAWGVWFSQDSTYQLQTFAFSKWHLMLLDSPQGIARDWAWANGTQQVWGLGVPLILYLFSFFNTFFPIPDRLVFSLLWIIVVTLVSYGISHRGWLVVLYSAMLPALISPFVGIACTRLAVYEIAVLWGALLSIGLLGFVLLSLKKEFRYPYIAMTGLYAGFLPMVRPTLGVFWFAALALIVIELRLKQWKKIGLFLATSLLGFLTLIITNTIRFGSPFEFGHSLNVFGNELVMHMMKWPTFHLNYLWENFLDFIHALITFASNHDFMLNPLAPESSYHRSKEFYFRLVTPLEFFAGILFCYTSYRSKHRESRVIALYALITGSLLFLFYLISPIFSSRYLMDLSPCLYAAFLSICLLPAVTARDRRVAYCFGAFILFNATQFHADALWYAATRSAVPSEKIFVHPHEAYKLFSLPTLEEHCPIKNLNSFFTSPVFLVERGWNIEKDCSVGFASSFIFKGRQCLTLRGTFTTPEQFAAKSGNTRMIKTYQSGRRVTFCQEGPLEKEFEAYFVRYVENPRKITPHNTLRSIEAHEIEAKERD